MTPRMKQCLDFLKRYKAENGYMPNFDEIRVCLGLKSKSGVFRLLDGLEQRGLIERLPHRARAIVIADTCHTCGRKHETEAFKKETRFYRQIETGPRFTDEDQRREIFKLI